VIILTCSVVFRVDFVLLSQNGLSLCSYVSQFRGAEGYACEENLRHPILSACPIEYRFPGVGCVIPSDFGLEG
jgi:hypothetical protein